MADISKKLGEMTFDGLITDLTPPAQVRGGTVTKLDTKATYLRGTILCRSSGTGGDGKLKALGTAAGSNETLTPDCILCDDTEVGTDNDVNVAVYTAGCFNPDKVHVINSHSITQDEKDKLRERGIVFKAPSPAN